MSTFEILRLCSIVPLTMLLTLVACCTSPRSLLRYVAVGIIAASTWTALSSYQYCISNRPWRSTVQCFILSNTCSCIERIFISRWNVSVGGPEQEVDPGTPKVDGRRLQNNLQSFAINTTISPRYVGTPWQVKNVPRLSSKHSDHIPSRGQFIRSRLFAIICCFIFIDATSQMPPPDPEVTSVELIPLFRRFGAIGYKEIQFRFMSTLGFWTGSYCLITMFTNLVAVTTVILGVSSPVGWPPSHGPVREIYSVRKFWG